MELILETVMGILLDAAMLVLILHLIKASDCEKKGYRLVSGTCAAAFALGVADRCVAGNVDAVMILYALGFMLAYTAFVFTFPGKRKRNEGR